MIGFIKGEIADVTEDILILETGGVGFEIKISAGTAAELPAAGEEIKIYTYMSVKEDDISLFGFLTKDDLSFFKLLITVSGIGPKGAQQILSALSPDDLRFAILAGDAGSISKAPGIGLKTAQKVILELKDKISLEEAFEERSAHAASDSMLSDAGSEAAEALVALGYSSTDAFRAVKRSDVSDDMSANDILKAALKHIGA